jgi:hypothetical protein
MQSAVNLSKDLFSLYSLRREFFFVYFLILGLVFMSKIHRQAGQNVRGLAFRRRKKAITYFISAGFVILSPLFGVKFVENFLRTIVSLNPSYSQILSNLPPILYIFCIVTALALVSSE